MALVAVAADKGAPGVSTATLALALTWPRAALLVECDPAGADLPWRLRGQGGRPLSVERGLVSLAAASRGRRDPGLVWEHTQRLDGGLPVLVGPAGPEQAEAIGPAWDGLAALLAALPGTDVLADCGRLLTSAAPVAPLLQRADLVLLITRPTVAGVAHLRHGITVAARIVNAAAGGGSGLARLGVLVVDDAGTTSGRRGGVRQVEEVLVSTPGLNDVPVAGVLAHDPAAAAALAGGGGRLHRSRLLASAGTVGRALTGQLPTADERAEGSGDDATAPAATRRLNLLRRAGTRPAVPLPGEAAPPAEQSAPAGER